MVEIWWPHLLDESTKNADSSGTCAQKRRGRSWVLPLSLRSSELVSGDCEHASRPALTAPVPLTPHISAYLSCTVRAIMGVEGCTKCVKYLLFFFNFIFWLAGGVILGVALWLRQDPKTSTLLGIEYQGTQAPTRSTSFFACLIILFACEVAAGIWGYMNKETVSKEMITFYDSFYSQATKIELPGTEDRDRKAGLATVLKLFHETLQCCGKGGAEQVFTIISQAAGVSDICPNSFTAVNCHDRINELFSDKIYLIGISALIIAVIMILR
ncbi:hypothetical protein WMY93_013209 [Mugilogobius chulae]|uniref:Tetraspanin n=1 Tax=Mugilogobius chulae TaxID=88201 RepID=A0AAW0P0Z5_9GOBI